MKTLARGAKIAEKPIRPAFPEYWTPAQIDIVLSLAKPVVVYQRGKRVDFSDALRKLREGQNIAREAWEYGEHLTYEGTGRETIWFVHASGFRENYLAHPNDLLALDWVLVT